MTDRVTQPRTPTSHTVSWVDAGRDEPPENGYWRCRCGVTFAPDGVDSGIAHGLAEGRREAVREIRAELPGYTGDLNAEETTGYDFALRHFRAILDRVTGLDASESPPDPERGCGHEVLRPMVLVDGSAGWECINCREAFRLSPAYRGDASESGQPPDQGERTCAGQPQRLHDGLRALPPLHDPQEEG